MKKLLILSLSLLALVFVGCSSDIDELGGTRSMNEYTPDQIQQIQNLQEEYGVTFDFPTKSEKELPSVKDFEDLCKTFAYLNASKEEVTRVGNSIKCKTLQKVNTRAYSQGKESTVKEKYYSGNHSGRGEIVGDGKGSYGSVSYEISWSNVNMRHRGSVTYQINSIYSSGGWTIISDGSFSYFVSSNNELCFSFGFEAFSENHGYRVTSLSYSSSVSLSGQDVTIK